MEEAVSLIVDKVIPILIAEMNSYSWVKTVYSAFRTTDITGLPVNHGDMFARWCKNCNRWNLGRYFSNIWGGIGADPVPDIVSVTERLVSSSI